MNVQTTIYPSPVDEPQGHINPGDDTTHPFAVVYFGANLQGPWLALSQLSDDDAVAFLDALGDVASSLATKIRVRQAADAPIRFDAVSDGSVGTGTFRQQMPR